MENETRFLAAEGRAERIIVARLLPGTDLIGGVAAVCRKHDIRQGYIGCVIGSLREAVYALPVPDASTPSGIRYSDPIKVGGPIELIGGQGVICRSPEGELLIHFHANFCDPDGKSLAGHFTTGGNPVLVTAEMVITEISGLSMLRRPDPEVGLMMLSPEP